jgi:hypothetical protein
MTQAIQDLPPVRGHAEQHRPLGAYALLTAIFAALSGGFAAWFARSPRELPNRIDPADFALITAATHKSARLLAKDRVTSAVRAPFTVFEGDAGPAEVSEAARGTGLRRAIGELLVCPFCLNLWAATFLTAGLLVFPRPTRWIATVFAVLFGADLLQIAYKKAEEAL